MQLLPPPPLQQQPPWLLPQSCSLRQALPLLRGMPPTGPATYLLHTPGPPAPLAAPAGTHDSGTWNLGGDIDSSYDNECPLDPASLGSFVDGIAGGTISDYERGWSVSQGVDLPGQINAGEELPHHEPPAGRQLGAACCRPAGCSALLQPPRPCPKTSWPSPSVSHPSPCAGSSRAALLPSS